jgi:hypothetical protein
VIGHTALILVAMVISISVVAAGVTLAYHPQNYVNQNNNNQNNNTPTPTVSNSPVDTNLKDTIFTPVEGEGNYEITVKINLDNGMNRAEALLVANKICGFDKPDSKLHHTEGAASVDSLGVWHVHYQWGLGDEKLTHIRFTDIYPSNQTFSFSSCC